jgi:hypothetical protein
MTLLNLKQSKDALSKGELIQAIECLKSTSYFSAVMTENQMTSELRTFVAKAGGIAKNNPTNTIKEAFIQHFKDNREKYENNKTKATDEMITMIGKPWYNQKWRTAREWLNNV